MSILETLEHWLRNEYKNRLGVTLSSMPDPTSTAVWLCSHQSHSQNAQLLDADLGTWFKFIVLSEASQTRGIVSREVQEALSECSQLLPRSGLPTDRADNFGTWTITLLFLVNAQCLDEWDNAIQTLRSESGFTEEIAIDRIVYTDASTFAKQLDTGRELPQLLLASRELLKLPPKEMHTWLTADAEIEVLLEQLPNRFNESADKELITTMITQVRTETHSRAKGNLPDQPHKINSIEIENFRNISDFKLQLKTPQKLVSVNIIYGPNGTGKSSIFEGVSFAVVGTSKRMSRYLLDKDIRQPSIKKYFETVLSPFNTNAIPSISCDGEQLSVHEQANIIKADADLDTVDGTLLAQEDARDFVAKSGQALGLTILSGYSRLAQALQSYCEREYQTANSQRQDWLRQFGIMASVTRADSRLTKLIDHYLSKQVPPGSQQIAHWLEAYARLIPSQRVTAQSLAAKWLDVDGSKQRETLAQRLLEMDALGVTDECQASISRWIKERNSILQTIENLTVSIESVLRTLAEQRSEISEDLTNWQTWLGNQASSRTVTDAKATNVDELISLRRQLDELKMIGTTLSDQRQHLAQLSSTLLPAWSERHPDICPTCNSNHHEHGGILSVVQKISVELDKKIQVARKEYSEKLTELRTVERSRSQLGQCPLSEERREYLSKLLGKDSEGYASLESELKDGHVVSSYVQVIDSLLAIPPLPLSSDPTQVGKQLWKSIESENARGAALWDLPTRCEESRGCFLTD